MATSIPETVVTISRPREGETISVATETQRVYHLTFEPVDVLFNIEQANLIIVFDEHTQVVLRDFGRAVESGTVFFELSDGAIIDANEMYQNFLVQDFETHVALPETSVFQTEADTTQAALPMPVEEKQPLSLNDMLTPPEHPLLGPSSAEANTAAIGQAEGEFPHAYGYGTSATPDAETEAEALMRLFSIIG